MITVISIIAIISSFILVGVPIKYNCLELNIIIIIAGIIFEIYKIVIKKEKIKIQKIDIVICIFYISPIIPLLFNTYESLEETMISLIRNISLFNLYIMAKEMLNQQSEKEKYLLNAIIIGGIILALIGIDEMTVGIISKKLQLIGIPYIINIEKRMMSSVGYANTFAILMAVEILICCNQIKSSSKKILKIIYSLLICLFGICLFLTYSRSVIALLITVILIYVIFVKKKRIYLLITGISIVLICISYLIGIKLEKPLVLFESQESSDQVRREIYNVETDTYYTFRFDIEANTRFINMDNYSIKIAEEDKYYDTLLIHEIKFGNYQGEKEISFRTTKDTTKIVIYFNSIKKVSQKGLTIKSLHINDEKFALNYAYLPIKLVERVQSFNLKNKSAWERGVYFEDSIKIIKDNALFGTGSRGWLYNYENVQSYTYASTEPHSYIFQTFIDNGIIGFLSLSTIIIYAVIIILKKKKNINEVDLAFIILNLHGFMDFDLSFYCIMVLWIALFAIINKDHKDIENKLINTSIIILNIISIILCIFTYEIKNENKEMEENIFINIVEEKYEEAIELIKIYCEKEKNYDFELEMIDYSKISNENLKYVYEILSNQELIVNTEKNIYKNEIIKRVLQTAQDEEYLTKFANIIISENEEMVKNITNQEKNRLSEMDIARYLQEQKEIYDLAISKVSY